MQISLSAPEELPPLSAATEVAAFRIVEEALTNVVHHAQAQQCQICLALTGTGELAMTITDNGKGLPQTYQASVGMHSIESGPKIPLSVSLLIRFGGHVTTKKGSNACLLT